MADNGWQGLKKWLISLKRPAFNRDYYDVFVASDDRVRAWAPSKVLNYGTWIILISWDRARALSTRIMLIRLAHQDRNKLHVLAILSLLHVGSKQRFWRLPLLSFESCSSMSTVYWVGALSNFWRGHTQCSNSRLILCVYVCAMCVRVCMPSLIGQCIMIDWLTSLHILKYTC